MPDHPAHPDPSGAPPVRPRADAADLAGVEGPALPPARHTSDLSPGVALVAQAAAGPDTPAPAGERPRHPLVEMLLIAAPTVVTMTSYTVMQFIDAYMVSRAGERGDVYLTAQGNGGMTVWLTMSVVLGLVGVINTYVSQNIGAGRPERTAAYAWAGLWIAAAMAVLMVPYALAIPAIYRALGHDEGLIPLETSYARILCYGAFFTLASRALSHFFYGIHRPLIIMVCALGANFLNIFLNAVLIFGRDGLPEGFPLAGVLAPAERLARALDIAPMGVTGAALGTVIGTSVELIVPLAVFLSARYHRVYATRRGWRPSWPPVRDVLKLGWPAGLMFGNEMICWGYLMAGLLPKGGQAAGEDPVLHNTAGWIALRYMHLSFMPAVGMSIAVTAIVGKCMGMGRPDLAARRAWLGVSITVGYMALCALAFVALREPMVRVFIDTQALDEARVADLVRIGTAVMIAAAVFQIFDALGITLSGALRGAGDTIWPGVVTVVFAWALLIGLGHAMIWVAPGLGSIGPWIAASAYIIALGLALLGRFVRGRWKSIRLVEGAAPAGAH
jgi:MATE family multidrug resistance protein